MNRKKKKTERERERLWRRRINTVAASLSESFLPSSSFFLFVTKQPVPSSSTKKEEGYRLKREAQVPT